MGVNNKYQLKWFVAQYKKGDNLEGKIKKTLITQDF